MTEPTTARSAYRLRLGLAGFGLVACAAAAVCLALLGVAWLAVVMGVLAVVALVDIGVILRRLAGRRGGGRPGP